MSKAKKGGKRRAGTKTSYYTAGYLRTTRNKLRKSMKRARRKAFWQEQGVKKNGEPVAMPAVATQPA